MFYIYIYIYIYISVAAAGLSKRGSSFSAYIIKIVYLFIRKFSDLKNKECGVLLCEMYDENWLAISPSKYQEIGCSSLSFNYTCNSGVV